MNNASVLTIAVFFTYTLVSWWILGPLESISETWYRWRDQHNYSSAFNWFGLAACACCVYQTHYYGQSATSLLLVGSGVCMWLLTVASPYKQYNAYHIIPTLLAIGLGYAAVWAHYGFSWMLWLSLGVGALGSALLTQVPHKTLWQELLILCCIMGAFLWI